MRLPLVLALVALALNIVVDAYVYSRLQKRPGLRKAHAALSVVLTLLWIGIICVPKRIGDDSFLLGLMWVIYAYWTVYMPKYVAAVFDIVAAIPMIWHGRRWRIVSGAGTVCATLVFAAMWWGATEERFRLDIKKIEIEIPNLPTSMQGTKLVQISDWHVGSYGTDTTFVSRTVDAINALRPDAVLFTGDLVNRHSDELRPFTGVLSRLKAPMGVYSVMGNHDYGDYYRWPDEQAHRADADSLRAMQADMGWRVLDNAMVNLGEIKLIGVENIGDPPFRTHGDLRKACPGLADLSPKILMSHNPAHWIDSIAGRKDVNIALTLSGHTHAMQIEVAGFSPAKWRYPKWGGLYDDNAGHKLYVNTGLGTPEDRKSVV